MLHRPVWDVPSASSRKKLSLRLGTGVEYVAWHCMGHCLPVRKKKLL